MALATRPYYRSSYVFVWRKDRALALGSFDDPKLKRLRIGVHIIGDTNLATRVPAYASDQYARKMLDLLKLIIDADANLTLNREDEIVAATLLCTGGEIIKKS